MRINEGATFRCSSCQTEIEVVTANQPGGPLVCCEVEMKSVDNEFDKLWEQEAYDVMDYEWN